MRNLILAAVGIAAWRWLTAPADQSANQTGANNRQQPRINKDAQSAAKPQRTQPSRLSGSSDADQTPEEQGRTGEVTYRVVEHDGGWAYKVGDVFSETYGSHDDALNAANAAARAQQMAGDPEPIEYQDENGEWRQEDADGQDRPHTDVEDTQPRMG